jgi:predicted HTH transcriptional regulator
VAAFPHTFQLPIFVCSSSALKLADILQEKINVNNSESTIRRRLRELKNAGKIEYKGSNKTGGYYIV